MQPGDTKGRGVEGGVKESISLAERKVADQKISRFERPWSFVDASSKTRSHHKRSQNRYEHDALLFFSSLLPSLFLRSFLLFSSSSFFFPPIFLSFPSFSSFSSRLLLLLPFLLLLLGEIAEEGERFHVVNGRSKGIDGDPLKASKEEAIAL